MTSQFRNPLPRKDPSASQNEEWLTGGPQPATSNDQPQGKPSPTEQVPPARGSSLVMPPWPIDVQSAQAQGSRQTPQPPSLADISTLKQPSVNNSPSASFIGPQPLPQTPGVYVQGQHGVYGSVSNRQMPPPNGPQGMPPQPGGGPAFTPMQRPPGPIGGPNSLHQLNPASSASLGPNPFAQRNAGSSFSMPGMGAALASTSTAVPGTFNPDRPAWSTSSGDGPRGNGGNSGPPDKNPNNKKRRKKRRFPIWARVLVGVLTCMIILGGIGFGYYQVNFASSVNKITGQKVALEPGEENPNANQGGDILSGNRINILLLGSDTDEKFQGNYIAQTDIVVTIDPSTKTVGMLSIPRDFYINVPGGGLHKLDEAYGLGGVGKSRQTIEDDFGITINYYAWVGLDGFIKVINDVGGVDVDLTHPITDDNYPDDVGSNNAYAVKRLYLAPGPQHLDGQTALEYVRSRHADLVGDFGRSVRQQQVITALKTKLDNPNIFGKLSTIANDLVGFLKTDMQLTDVLKLMTFARDLDVNKITKLVLGPPYSSSGTATSGGDSGASVVFPNCSKIVPAIDSLFQSNSLTCNIDASGDTGGAPSLASSSDQSTPLVSSTTTGSSNPGAALGDTTASLSSGTNGLFGVESLLELMFLGVFESPTALQL